MSNKKAWQPIFDRDRKIVGEGDFGHGHNHDHKPRRRIARSILILAAAIGFGYWLNTPMGHEWTEIAKNGLSSSLAAPGKHTPQ